MSIAEGDDTAMAASALFEIPVGQTKGGIVVCSPPKPKGMHWQTYGGTQLAALKEEREILVAADLKLFRTRA